MNNTKELIELSLLIDLENGEVSIEEKGSYRNCTYEISYLNEISKCLDDYIKTYCYLGKGDTNGKQ